jgi:hypothetical protein
MTTSATVLSGRHPLHGYLHPWLDNLKTKVCELSVERLSRASEADVAAAFSAEHPLALDGVVTLLPKKRRTMGGWTIGRQAADGLGRGRPR